MENKHNPSSHTSPSWSNLPLDLVISVLERLSFANFQRGKSVCSSWYSASRQAHVPNNQIPWLILFPRGNNSCTLFNPEEKDKLYKTKNLGLDFAKSVCKATYRSWLLKSVCKATYRSWLLMQDLLHNIYIVNLFTNERINLPSVELLMKEYDASHRRMWFRGFGLQSPFFWIDEKTKDYVVISGFRDWCVVYAKKGDVLWNKIPETSDCYHMVYKEHKLYFLSKPNGIFKIFDFSGEMIPRETFKCHRLHLEIRLPFYQAPNSRRLDETKLVVTVAGKVLKVQKWWRQMTTSWSFRFYEIYSKGLVLETKKRIRSLGNESMLWDQGITVLANDSSSDGTTFTRDSIYFSGSGYGKNTNDIFNFSLKTKKTEPKHTFDNSSLQFCRAQWFIPNFTHL